MSDALSLLDCQRFHPPSSIGSCGRATLPPYSLKLPQPESGTLPQFVLGSGLQTPPVDDMSATYHPAMAPASAYDSNAVSAFSASIARGKPAMIDGNGAQYPRYAQQQAANPSQQRYNNVSVGAQVVMASTQSSRPITPKTEHVMPQKEQVKGTGSAETLIFHSLQIPRCINPNGGNLAEFAAQMTCLFWFETMDDLKQAESIRLRPANAPIPRLPPLARPYEQFKKWVYNVLSTTQVTQNVILLALLFIYRLRKSTPQIKGRAGSEYRLLTVALMLGNKFLDDNTYTNKTWAEVSSFAVSEIHVMEVEFLSNMRYDLLTSAAEWDRWVDKLSCFHEYYERALRLPPSPTTMPSTVGRISISPMPSPTSNGTLDVVDMFASTNYSPSSSQGQAWNAHAYQSNLVSPLAGKPSLALPSSRKRAHEDDQIDHPAKRPVPSRLAQIPSDAMHTRQNSAPVEPARLPVPHLTLVTNNPPQQAHPVSAYATPTGAYSQQVQAPATSQPHVSLPPLHGGVRAMATVYQPAASTSTVTQPATAPLPTSTAPSAIGGGPFAGQTLTNHQQFGTPTKRHSPGSLGPFTSSPMAEPFGPGSAVPTPLAHTPLANSPSIYLQHRNSPYKPIRHVNTLLYPPPSASLEQYHLPVPLQPAQMHYQPLGRRNDLRTGVVPEYILYNRGQVHPQAHQPQQHFPPQQQQQQHQPRPQNMQQGLPYQS